MVTPPVHFGFRHWFQCLSSIVAEYVPPHRRRSIQRGAAGRTDLKRLSVQELL
jgi:hypothetical protein